MSLIRYNSSAPARNLNGLFDSFFNRNLTDFFGSDYRLTNPSVNVKETEHAFVIEVAAPGLEKGDFKINIEKGNLTVSASRENKEEVEARNYKRREFDFTSFSRNFVLPESVNIETIEASYNDGVLSINAPKLDEAKVDPKRIVEIG